VWSVLASAVQQSKNILISGGTSSGKSTLAKVVLDEAPASDRLIVIEKPRELAVSQPNALRWEARDATPSRSAVTVAHLLVAALRHRPDRIVIGEVREPESAYELLQAMNSGHAGTLSTIHADSAQDALHRLSDLALAAHSNLSTEFQFAKQRLSERTAVMEWHEIHRDALRFGRGYITLPDVEQAFARAKERGEFKRVEHWREYAPESRYTTPELEAKEREILAWMAAGRGRAGAIAGHIARDEFREQFRDRLNDGQKWLVWNVIHSQDRMIGVWAWPGPGKRQLLPRYGILRNGMATKPTNAFDMPRLQLGTRETRKELWSFRRITVHGR